ncbi:MAG TPA: hypothetical protein VNO70_21665 [Blastocatellia bacterium]|nr:hypothetical protein [Blastocatellia bacterium]
MTELLNAYERHGQTLARLPFVEKIRIVERLQRLSKTIPKFQPLKHSAETPAPSPSHEGASPADEIESV